MLDKLKKNWIYFLIFIPFILICLFQRTVYQDIWFILNNGRYVLNNGVPSVDPFTIHEGLHYIMQQWLSAVIFYTIYSKIGKYGLFGLVCIASVLITYILYKICYLSSENKIKSLLITAVAMSAVRCYIVLRPQILTYLILLIEVLCLESYIKYDKKKYLYVLPVLSILEINLHASMWYFQFIFLLPFIFNAIKIKGITIDTYKIKPILITVILMFIGGFINPYGYKALLFIFESYGLKEINVDVDEMNPISFSLFEGKVIILYLAFIILMLNFLKKKKLDVRHILFICGVTILGFMHTKCFPYTIFMYSYAIAYGLKNANINIKLQNKIVNALLDGLKISLKYCLIITFIFTFFLTIKYYKIEDIFIYDIIDYIDENYNKENIILYTCFNSGGYAEFKGYRTYIDGRAELFYKKLNKKEDIYKEYAFIEHDKENFDFEEFINKYNFTHIIVDNIRNQNFAEYLSNSDDFEEKYVQWFDPSTKELAMRTLYVSKEYKNE